MVARFLRVAALITTWCALAIWCAWSVGLFSFSLSPWPARIAIALFGIGVTVAILIGRSWRRPTGVAACCGIATLWFFTLSPSNDREWNRKQAQTAYAEIDGETITIHGVRNCNYRTANDYDVRYESRTVDLAKLSHLDMFLCYWGSEWLAHPIMSFYFDDALPICFSIEARRESHEGYTTLGGLFRQYELYYAVGDERDFVRLRTEFREGEDVYLYRLKAAPKIVRELFLAYLSGLNDLHTKPRFYNVLTSNCTTNLRTHAAATSRGLPPWNWRILLTGKFDELIHDRDGFTADMPLDELKPRAHVNPIADDTGGVADFSQRIRARIPGF